MGFGGGTIYRERERERLMRVLRLVCIVAKAQSSVSCLFGCPGDPVGDDARSDRASASVARLRGAVSICELCKALVLWASRNCSASSSQALACNGLASTSPNVRRKLERTHSETREHCLRTSSMRRDTSGALGKHGSEGIKLPL